MKPRIILFSIKPDFNRQPNKTNGPYKLNGVALFETDTPPRARPTINAQDAETAL